MFWTPHPMYPIPSAEEVKALTKNADGTDNLQGLIELERLWQAREDAIELSEHDPLEHGFMFRSWHEALAMFPRYYEVVVFGGNGSSKSEFGAYCVVKALLSNPGAKVVCFAQDKDASVRIQQELVYKYLPPQFKEDHKTLRGGYVKHTPKNGFTDDSFFLDVGDGSKVRECYFKTYSQFFLNRSKFEGFEYGSRQPRWNNVGAWLDEYLLGPELYNTLLYRLVRRGANMLATFTPIKGVTPFVKSKMDGSKLEKSLPASPKLFWRESDPKQVDWVRSKTYSEDEEKSGVGMVFFPSEDNPWSGFRSALAQQKHKSLEERLVRFHGITTQVVKKLLPLFTVELNVVSDESPNRYGFMMPQDFTDQSKWTSYLILDPASARNYVMLWVVVNSAGDIYAVREWPDKDTYDDWAVPGDPNWKVGPAADKFGYDIPAYVGLIRDIEDEVNLKPFIRIGDSRYFSRPQDNNRTLFEDFAESGMTFEASDGRTIRKGAQMLDDWFYYNTASAIDSSNRPRFFVHERCGNLITALENYQNEGKRDEALKDFFDLVRMARTFNGGEGIRFYPPNLLEQEAKQTTWGY